MKKMQCSYKECNKWGGIRQKLIRMQCSFSPNILVIYLEELLSLYYYIMLEYKFNKDQQKIELPLPNLCWNENLG
jgi:hypothetical protein